VRVLQTGGEANLLLEPIGSQMRRDVGVENLERDRPLVPEVLGQEDSRKSAVSELALDAVPCAQRVRQGFANRQ